MVDPNAKVAPIEELSPFMKSALVSQDEMLDLFQQDLHRRIAELTVSDGAALTLTELELKAIAEERNRRLAETLRTE